MIFLTQHAAMVLLVLYYIIQAAISALPDKKEDFRFYDWFLHTARMLLNIVPMKYKLPEGPKQ